MEREIGRVREWAREWKKETENFSKADPFLTRSPVACGIRGSRRAEWGEKAEEKLKQVTRTIFASLPLANLFKCLAKC